MTLEERNAITTSIANLWTFNAIFIAQLVKVLSDSGVAPEKLELLIQGIDAASEALEGETERSYAIGLAASVRSILKDC